MALRAAIKCNSIDDALALANQARVIGPDGLEGINTVISSIPHAQVQSALACGIPTLSDPEDLLRRQYVLDDYGKVALHLIVKT